MRPVRQVRPPTLARHPESTLLSHTSIFETTPCSIASQPSNYKSSPMLPAVRAKDDSSTLLLWNYQPFTCIQQTPVEVCSNSVSLLRIFVILRSLIYKPWISWDLGCWNVDHWTQSPTTCEFWNQISKTRFSCLPICRMVLPWKDNLSTGPVTIDGDDKQTGRWPFPTAMEQLKSSEARRIQYCNIIELRRNSEARGSSLLVETTIFF